MPTIPGETARGTRLLPAVTAGQALGLLATAALTRWAASGHSALIVRAVRALPVCVGGLAYVFGRWPWGVSGERLAVWLPRVVRYGLTARTRRGGELAGWEGLHELRPEGLWHDRGGAIVLECTVGAQGLTDGEGQAAAQVAYREFLHSLEAPLQVVGTARWIREEDLPPLWDGSRAPGGLEGVVRAYHEHWGQLVATRAAVVRRSLLVLSVPGPRARSAAATALVREAAALRFLRRMGLEARRVRGDDLARLVLEAAGAADAGGAVARAEGYRVGEQRA